MSAPATDPLRPLLDLQGVPEAVDTAREAIDEAHRHPANRRGWPTTAAEASVRAARASAAVAGGATEIPESGEVSDPLLAGSLRVAESLGPLLPTWQRAPLQALARLHVLAAADLVGPGEQERLGRPRTTDAAGGNTPGTSRGHPDPGASRGHPEPRAVTTRLDMLARIVAGADDGGATGSSGGTRVPGPVLAAVVHGELLSLAPFGDADGIIARAAARLSIIGTGLDPKGLVVPEVAYFRRQADYARALEGFASGEPEGVGGWIVYCCEALRTGAKEAGAIADAVG